MLGWLADVVNSLQENAFCSMQLQTLSSGVGGRVVDAMSEAFCAGHWSVEAVTLDFAGVVGGFVELYWAERRVKSSDVVTLPSQSQQEVARDNARLSVGGDIDHAVSIARWEVAERHTAGEDVGHR